MNLRECFNRYSLKESFIRKTSSVNKKGMIEDEGNGFRIDNREDLNNLLWIMSRNVLTCLLKLHL